jgi:hypothetical protein
MDELEAMKILRNEMPKSEEETVADDRKLRQIEELISFIGAILFGLFIIILLYSIIVHPIDKILIKMALIDNYVITTTVAGNTQKVYVDGNIIRVNDTYYEVAKDAVYVYRKNAAGEWTKKVDSLSNSDADTSWVKDVLDKKNYKRNILPWKPMEYTGSEDILGMDNVTTQVILGKCAIEGEIERRGVFGGRQIFFVTIQIHKFGLVHLKLPKVNTK